MLNPILPCDGCGKRVPDFQSLNHGKLILGEKCIRKLFRMKKRERVYGTHYCQFHETWETTTFHPLKVSFLWFFSREIFICTSGVSEIFGRCRKGV